MRRSLLVLGVLLLLVGAVFSIVPFIGWVCGWPLLLLGFILLVLGLIIPG